MKCVGLLPHTGKPEALELASEVLDMLATLGVEGCLDPESAALVGRPDRVRPLEGWHEVDVAIVLGGDGALLKAARLLAPHGVPLLGVNLGHFGFLTEVESGPVAAVLRRLLAGEYTVEERMMLDVRVMRDGQVSAAHIALNDAVITRGTFARVVSIDSRVGGEEVLRFRGDGIIVSTPTGSTAYALSAGGPIVNPLLDCIVLTPICPHALATRAVVLRPEEQVDISVSATHEDIMLTVDGQVGTLLRPSDAVRITRSRHRTRLVRLGERSFYALLRNRMTRGAW